MCIRMTFMRRSLNVNGRMKGIQMKIFFSTGLTGDYCSGIIPLSPEGRHADLAQLVEQLIRNEQVVGSSPIISSI